MVTISHRGGKWGINSELKFKVFSWVLLSLTVKRHLITDSSVRVMFIGYSVHLMVSSSQ